MFGEEGGILKEEEGRGKKSLMKQLWNGVKCEHDYDSNKSI